MSSFRSCVRNDLDEPARLNALPNWAQSWLHVFDSGGFAVALFIVLSGFADVAGYPKCRGATVARLGDFFKPRISRLLPPYYVTVALCLAAPLMFSPLAAQTFSTWDKTRPALATGPVISHLLRIHNLSDQWILRINYALWSIATECIPARKDRPAPEREPIFAPPATMPQT